MQQRFADETGVIRTNALATEFAGQLDDLANTAEELATNQVAGSRKYRAATVPYASALTMLDSSLRRLASYGPLPPTTDAALTGVRSLLQQQVADLKTQDVGRQKQVDMGRANWIYSLENGGERVAKLRNAAADLRVLPQLLDVEEQTLSLVDGRMRILPDGTLAPISNTAPAAARRSAGLLKNKLGTFMAGAGGAVSVEVGRLLLS